MFEKLWKRNTEPVDSLGRLELWMSKNFPNSPIEDIYELGQGLAKHDEDVKLYKSLVNDRNLERITKMTVDALGGFDLVIFFAVKSKKHSVLLAYVDPFELYDNGYILAYQEVENLSFEDLKNYRIKK